MKTISILTLKGGTGKTTTAQTLAYILRNKGYKVLLIDADSQANLTKLERIENDLSIYDLLINEADIKKVIEDDFITGSPQLPSKQDEIQISTLKDALKKVSKVYDYCIIDNAPTITKLLMCMLCASDYLLIPSDTQYLSAFSIKDIYKLYINIKKSYNQKLELLGVFLIKYKANQKAQQGIRESIKDLTEALKIKFFETYIHESAKINEAQIKGKNLIEYDPKCKAKATQDYINLIDEILKEIGER